MADIMLRTNSSNQVTCVSNIFIDDFMKDANGEYVKIYLFLLRCLGRDDFEFSLAEVADRLDHTEKDIMRAFTYWEKVGLLHLEYSSENELSGICLVDVKGHDQTMKPVVTSTFTKEAPATNQPVPSKVVSTSPQSTTITKQIDKPVYSPDELDAFSSLSGTKDLFFTCEYYLGRPLSTSETTTILFWYDSLHMHTDLIQYMIEYCLSNHHDSFHYMDSVARNWVSNNIDTLEKAKQYNQSHNDTVYSIKKAFGISNRELIQTELDYINKWTIEYQFSIDVITDACKRTIIATNKPNFKYADTILSKWHSAGTQTLEDIAKLDEKFVQNNSAKLHQAKTTASKTPSHKKSNSFNNFSNRDFDYNALAKTLLQ